ncbi:hypothetical protein KY290_005673 [Solanum tuberosum]|uniref:Uncharacterized protein n=1 Tax=Solanum tuberosum TaxID=4113 RepID=A0ABQ7WGW1_SOLTU|nr:hypothetical protein KY284_005770 [Solanum tuberosum]KAH0723000.1 hypothetical protein KY289_006044 [Solanum tuberosum]KAH0723006.1 hypothetical protein KY289_006050 [Solanum tuberosum]KAH0752407.1 hypothetical protein KY285_005555 [Solanum tuberosum]KAH0779235.1 hypothetical protein KY290_005662 [Solanum tuberosum]
MALQNMQAALKIGVVRAKTNKDVLLGNVLGNFAGSSTALTVNPVHRQVVSIVEVTTATSVGVFYIEAEMSISDDLQKFLS